MRPVVTRSATNWMVPWTASWSRISLHGRGYATVNREDRPAIAASGLFADSGGCVAVGQSLGSQLALLATSAGTICPSAVVIDAVGIAPTFQQAFEARDLAGRMVLVGVPAPGTTWDIPLDEVFGRGGSIKSAWYGDTLPSRDFPMLVDQYHLGRLDLDGFVSERIGINDVEEAFAKMKAGAILRSVVEINPVEASR